MYVSVTYPKSREIGVVGRGCNTKRELIIEGFLENSEGRGIVALVDEAVRSKEENDRFIKNLAVFCKKRRRSHLLKRYDRLKRNRCYDEAIESVADEADWSTGTVRHVLGRSR